MTEIKYKAWYENSQTWVYFEFDKPMSLDAINVHTQLCIDGVKFYQYTGLKDKSGKEIYEGDILKHNRNLYKVIFSKNQKVILLKNINLKTNWRSLEWCGNAFKYIEIVENIHENPELL